MSRSSYRPVRGLIIEEGTKGLKVVRPGPLLQPGNPASRAEWAAANCERKYAQSLFVFVSQASSVQKAKAAVVLVSEFVVSVTEQPGG